MKIKRNAAFRLFAYGKDKNRYQIRFRVTFNSQRLDLKTGCQLVDAKAWDDEAQLVVINGTLDLSELLKKMSGTN
jgi:hypothetical protein